MLPPRLTNRPWTGCWLDPRYGERWGRHWMDVWRYSDWDGLAQRQDVRNSQPHIWRWRDWIVESLNADKGYDRMVMEMLAADETAPERPRRAACDRLSGPQLRSSSTATGWMQDAVEHTALGVPRASRSSAPGATTTSTTRSRSEEYYRFRAFFEPYEVRVDRVKGQVDTEKDGLSRIYDAELDRPTYLLVRGDIQNPDKENVLAPGVPRAFGASLWKNLTGSLPIESYYPDHRPLYTPI